MKTRFPLLRVAASVALVASGFLAAPVFADIKPTIAYSPTIDLDYVRGTFGGYVQFNGTGGTPSNLAGSLFLDAKATGFTSPVGSFATYCVQLGETASTEWKTYTLGDFGTTVARDLARLYSVAGGSPTTKDNSAAFQAAVWEITHESPTSSYSLLNGNFQGSFVAADIVTTATNWLNAVNGYTGSEPLFLAQKLSNVGIDGSKGAQDYLVITAVPEPGTYALMLAGLGLMATIARRRGRSVE